MHTDRKQIGSCQGLRRRGTGINCLIVIGFPCKEDENVLEVDRGNGCTIWWYTKCHWIIMLYKG